MKILLYSHSFLPKIGGRELVVYQLARALGSLGHDVRVMGPRLRWRDRPPATDVRVHRYPRLIKGRRRAGQAPAAEAGLVEREMMLQLVTDVRLFGADVIHAHSTYPAGYLIAMARRWLPDVPLVITPHGIDINVIPGFGLRLHEELRRKIDRALAAADAVTAISRGIVNALTNAGTDPAKIHQIPNGTDLQRFARSSNGAAIRRRFGLTPDDPIVLTVGNYHPRKGMEQLIRAFPQVQQAVPGTKLVIVGAGTDVLVPVAEAAAVREQVILTGRLPVPIGSGADVEDPLADLYAECSVYVSASNAAEAEGLSLAMLDALAAARPAVATRISGNEDIVAHGNNGFLVEPGDARGLADRITEVLRDPALAARLGAAGRRTAEQYSWLSVAAHYLRVYQSALAARLARSAASGTPGVR